jgi:hypothetical protein
MLLRGWGRTDPSEPISPTRGLNDNDPPERVAVVKALRGTSLGTPGCVRLEIRRERQRRPVPLPLATAVASPWTRTRARASGNATPFDRELRERRDRFIAATREELHAKLKAERAELRRLRRRRRQYEAP